jgi:hypothetical protein
MPVEQPTIEWAKPLPGVQRDVLQLTVDSYIAKGYMTLPMLARKYGVAVCTVERRLGKPDLVLNKGKKIARLYLRARAEEAMP